MTLEFSWPNTALNEVWANCLLSNQPVVFLVQFPGMFRDTTVKYSIDYFINVVLPVNMEDRDAVSSKVSDFCVMNDEYRPTSWNLSSCNHHPSRIKCRARTHCNLRAQSPVSKQLDKIAQKHCKLQTNSIIYCCNIINRRTPYTESEITKIRLGRVNENPDGDKNNSIIQGQEFATNEWQLYRESLRILFLN